MISERGEFYQIFLFAFEGDIKTQNFLNSHDSKNLLFKKILYFVKGWNQVLTPKTFHASRAIITGLVGIESFSKFFEEVKGVKNERVTDWVSWARNDLYGVLNSWKKKS